MAIQEKIKVKQDRCLAQIRKSAHLSDIEKDHLSDMVNDAAQGTNGLTHEEKVQNVSETTFLITTTIADMKVNLAEQQSTLNERIGSLEKQMEKNNELTQNLAEDMKSTKDALSNLQTEIALLRQHNQTSDSAHAALIKKHETLYAKVEQDSKERDKAMQEMFKGEVQKIVSVIQETHQKGGSNSKPSIPVVPQPPPAHPTPCEPTTKMDMAKALAMNPMLWVFLSILVVSPYATDIINAIRNCFK